MTATHHVVLEHQVGQQAQDQVIDLRARTGFDGVDDQVASARRFQDVMIRDLRKTAPAR
jgi:hypothetical protein